MGRRTQGISAKSFDHFGCCCEYLLLVARIALIQHQTILGLVVLIFQSSSIFRRAFYETFLHLHIALNLLIVVALWYHVPSVYSKRCLTIVIVIWALEVRSPLSAQTTPI